MLLGAGGSAAALLVPAAGAAAAAAGGPAIPFEGFHQAGVTTAQQARIMFAALDVTAADRSGLIALLRAWTEAARLLARGLPVGPPGGDEDAPPADTGEALGLAAARLTLTFGFGPSLFDGRFGPAARRPAPLINLPAFRTDHLDPARSGGDLAVQACSDDPQVCLHAIRNLARIARANGWAGLRWVQSGFARTPGESPPDATGRNLLGFRDGTNNLRASDTERMNRNVWVQPADRTPAMTGGTYMVVRRIRNRIEHWDGSGLSDQEDTIGRRKVTGAPYGQPSEHSPVIPAREPRDCHIMLANPRTAGSEAERILRRGYGFDDGLLAGGEHDAGLFFVAFQRDPRRQFVHIQTRLAAADRLNEYLVHTGSGIFAVPPGVKANGFVGETLI